ncbi:MAG: hypothetical protein Q8L87_00665 [Anaerolineales bacterium]|jgi:hypothetical protein|nr:hypothetical protein [Anaerolineales bacterium]
MKQQIHWKVVPLVITLLVLLAGGCGSGQKEKIETSIGTLTIVGAEVVETLPYSSTRAKPGYQILIVMIEGPNTEKFDLSTVAGVYVMGDDGSKTDAFVAGSASETGPFFGFTPPTTAKSFTLYWPENQPIELVLNK